MPPALVIRICDLSSLSILESNNDMCQVALVFGALGMGGPVIAQSHGGHCRRGVAVFASSCMAKWRF